MDFFVETMTFALFILLAFFTLHALLLLVSDTFRALRAVFKLRRVATLTYPPLGYAQNVIMSGSQTKQSETDS
jgi:hypothetical protein